MNPTERSISPQISSMTSPSAMMMIGAASWVTVIKLMWVKNACRPTDEMNPK